MDLATLLPLGCILSVAGFGALLYLLLVMTYRRQHETEIERKQRERRERAVRQQQQNS